MEDVSNESNLLGQPIKHPEREGCRMLIGDPIEPYSCCRRSTKSSVEWPDIIRFYLRWTLLRYGRFRSKNELHTDCNPQEPNHTDRLQFLSPLREHPNFVDRQVDRGIKLETKGEKSFLDSKWFRLSFLLLITYLTVKFIIIATLQTRHDHLIGLIRPKLRPNATRTTKCILKHDIYLDERDLVHSRQLDAVDYWLDLVGNPWTSVTGLGAILLGLFALIPMIFFYLGIYFINTPRLEVNPLGFLLDPLGEHLRARQEISGVIIQLIASIGEYFNCANKQNEPKGCNRNEFLLYPIVPGRGGNFNQDTTQVPIKRYKTCKHSMRKAIYVDMLLSIKLADLVRPENLGQKWQRILCSANQLHLPMMLITGFMPPFTIVASTVVYELYLRIKLRREQFECQHWQPTGIPIENTCPSLPLLKSETDAEAYELRYKSDTILAFIGLVLIEAKHFLSLRVMIFLSEIGLMLALVVIWVGFYFNIHALCYIDSIIWEKQIIMQVNYCCRLLEEFRWFHEQSVGKRSETSSKLKEIMKIITVTYVNFELFRQKQKSFRLLIDFLLLQFALMVFATLFLIYLISAGALFEHGSILLMLITYMVIAFDCYLVGGAMRTNRLGLLMRSIHRLHTKAVLNSIECSPIFEMWRRQMLSEEQAQETFANSFLGVCISYNRLLTFHIYLIGLYLVLLRAER